MNFPYPYYLTNPSPTFPTGILYRPEIPVRVLGVGAAVHVGALVDPGSDDTLFSLSLAKWTGAKIDSTRVWHTEGIGGQAVPIILGEVVFELTDGKQTFRWPTKVGLVDFTDPKDEVTILGQAGFLDYFRATFDGHLRTLEIEVTPLFLGR